MVPQFFIDGIFRTMPRLRDFCIINSQKMFHLSGMRTAKELLKSLRTKFLIRLYYPHYDPYARSVLRVDASTIGIGGHLTICRPDQPTREARLFACCSCTLSINEKNYGISQLECLAILFSIEKFHVYLHGTEFVVVTDHHALCYLQRLKKPNGRLFRWSNLVQGYDFEITLVEIATTTRTVYPDIHFKRTGKISIKIIGKSE